MTYEYDLERVRAACEDLMKAAEIFMKHKPEQGAVLRLYHAYTWADQFVNYTKGHLTNPIERCAGNAEISKATGPTSCAGDQG